MAEHELFPHPADQGIRGYGSTLEQAFQEIAKALEKVMVDTETIENKLQHEVEVKGEDQESLLIQWLNELLILFDTEKTIYKDFEVEINKEKNKLKGIAKGEKYNPKKHGPGEIVKAITYNELKIEKKGDRWMVQCVVDL